jgi:hypothetical protein
MLSGLQPSFMFDASLSFPLGPFYKYVLHCSEGKRGLSFAGLLPVESYHLAHPHQHPLCQRHWTKLNCWTCDYWLGGTVEVVTTLAHFQYLPQLNWCCLTLSLRHYQCQQSVQIFRWAAVNAASCLVSSFYANTHANYQMLNSKKQVLCATQHCGLKLSLKS